VHTQVAISLPTKSDTGFHTSLDTRTSVPRPYLAYYPALWSQDQLKEEVHFTGDKSHSLTIARPVKYEDVEQRASYDTANPVDLSGPTHTVRLGDVALARSGDKGANLNFGVFVDTKDKWDWLRTYLSRARVAQMLEDEMHPEYSIERVEFPKIFVVHFVVYGILGRGVSSSKRLDGFGKGFADYFREKLVEVPQSLL